MMPIDAAPLDDEAALQMLRWYGREQWHRLRFGPGVNLAKIKIKAAGSAAEWARWSAA
jgi:hypothetical protein